MKNSNDLQMLRFKFIENQITELRRELIEHQKIRSQINTLKITSTSTAIGIVIALVNANISILSVLLVIPVFVAVFLDFRMKSYTISIKRTGHYIRKYLEPKIKKYIDWNYEDPLWEEFMITPEANPNLDPVSKFGFTFLLYLGALTGSIAMDISWSKASNGNNVIDQEAYNILLTIIYVVLTYYLYKDYQNLNSECEFVAEDERPVE